MRLNDKEMVVCLGTFIDISYSHACLFNPSINGSTTETIGFHIDSKVNATIFACGVSFVKKMNSFSLIFLCHFLATIKVIMGKVDFELITNGEVSKAISKEFKISNQAVDYLNQNFSENNSIVDVEFCQELAKRCPFLTSSKARPWHPKEQIYINAFFRPTFFLGVSDIDETFSLLGSILFEWTLPACATWNSSVSPYAPEFCVFDRNEIWYPKVRHVNAKSKVDVFEK